MTSTPLVPEQSGSTAAPSVADPADAPADVSAEVAADSPTALERGRDVAIERGREAAERVGDAVSTIVGRIRNKAELAEDRGRTVIADEVVEKIAGIAAREVAGVFDLGGDVSRVFASLRERIGLAEEGTGEEANRGVRVRLDGTTAVIDLTIVIEFGYVVHSVTDAVRTKVIASVESMLGLEVTEVNIRVDDVHVAEPGALTP
jgi:uncharacterized alkaline shock family protein YloU